MDQVSQSKNFNSEKYENITVVVARN